jgi:hypothetical protein
MTDIDLGPVTVALTQVPTAAQASSALTTKPRFQTYTDEEAREVQALPRPLHLPAGLSFLDATLITSPVEMAICTYSDPATGRSLTLVRSPLATLKALEGAKPVVYVTGEALHEASVRTRDAARVAISTDPFWRGARTTLVWLQDDAVFQISGRAIDDADLTLAAESV